MNAPSLQIGPIPIDVIPGHPTLLDGLDPQRLPHFFIVGAPKCGTTALFSYLQGHPSTFLAVDRRGRKFEPQFFCTDFPGIAHFHHRDDYQALFDGAPQGALRGESSPWYLYSEVAVKQLLAAVPDAKLIVMLRNPVELARSLHGQLVFSLREDVDDFETAWHLQEPRRRGEALPRHCREPSHLQYQSVCSFAPQLARLFRHASRDQVKVILFEELVAGPRAMYLSVLDFLGLPDDDRASFPRVNEGNGYRNRAIIDALHRLPRGVDPLIYGVKRVANRSGIRPLGLLKRFNTKPRPRTALRPDFHRELEAAFEDDIRETEALLGRSLEPCWVRSLAA